MYLEMFVYMCVQEWKVVFEKKKCVNRIILDNVYDIINDVYKYGVNGIINGIMNGNIKGNINGNIKGIINGIVKVFILNGYFEVGYYSFYIDGLYFMEFNGFIKGYFFNGVYKICINVVMNGKVYKVDEEFEGLNMIYIVFGKVVVGGDFSDGIFMWDNEYLSFIIMVIELFRVFFKLVIVGEFFIFVKVGGYL